MALLLQLWLLFFFENASIGVGAEMEVEGTSFVAGVVFEECPMDPS